MEQTTAAIALIGDEILSGKVVDENARVLIFDLRSLGVALKRIIVLPDVLTDIAAAVRDLSERYTYVFTSGGVGPTHDDVTMAAIAHAFDTRIVRNAMLEQRLRAYYGDKLEERNLRMADIPHGCTFVAGESEWPVLAYQNVYILPGVPQIFLRKWQSIREVFRAEPFYLRELYSTLDEGSIAHHLDRVVAEFPDVQVGSYPKIDEPSYRVKITLEAKARDRVEAATQVLSDALAAGLTACPPLSTP